MRGGGWKRLVVPAWSVLIAGLMLGPLLGPGFVLTYDMVWVPDLALRPDFLGVGSGLPRAVPSDAVVAVLDELVPGMVLQKVVLVAAVAGGGIGAARLVPAPLVAQLVAVTVYSWNALVAERLFIGHWPLLLGYAALPWVLVAARSWRVDGRLPLRLLWLVPLGSLSASAGVATAVVLLAFAAGGGRGWRPWLLVGAANAPWLMAGLLHASSATADRAGAAVFALHGEGSVPGPLAALTLGGIWNAEVVPDSRTGVLGWLTLAVFGTLALLGARAWARRTPARDRTAYVVCWGIGFGAALVSWAAPDAIGWVGAHVPGAALTRDGARLLVLCAPLLVVLVAEGTDWLWRRLPTVAVVRAGVGVALVLAPVALLPDLAWGLAGAVRPEDYPTAYDEARTAVSELVEDVDGDVLVLPASSYRQPAWNHDQKVLDPLGRYLTPDYVASDVLVVSGEVISGEDPRMADAQAALALPSPEARSSALGELGIVAVANDNTAPGASPEVAGSELTTSTEITVVALPATTAREAPVGWVVAMVLAWSAFLGLLVAGAALAWSGAALDTAQRSPVGIRPELAGGYTVTADFWEGTTWERF